MGIQITDLRPEIQTLVNSDINKYDVDGNGEIEGAELQQLLFEYNCKEEDLTSTENKRNIMLTAAEKKYVQEQISQNQIGFFGVLGFMGGLFVPGLPLGALFERISGKAISCVGGIVTGAALASLASVFLSAHFQEKSAIRKLKTMQDEMHKQTQIKQGLNEMKRETVVM